MTRTRDQARQTQAVQQIIDAPQRVLDAELSGENLPGFFRPQAANPIGRRGVGPEPRFEPLVLRRGQLAGPTRWPLGAEGLQTMIAMRIAPTLHEPPTAVQDARDRGRLVTLQSQNHGAVAVSLLGEGLPAARESYRQGLRP
jgi:hypothetical protein